ncbi:MAG: glycosyltransferase [Acidobacteriota bacterium]
MRVLHVYSGNLYGGIETLLVTLARCQHLFPAMTHEFALCFEGRLMTELKAAGAVVHMLGGVRASRPLSIWQARRRLCSVLRQHSPDVVICHSAWPHALFAKEVRQAGRPLVFWLHGATEGNHWTERMARRTPPDLAICNSRFTAEMLPKIWPNVQREVFYYLVGMPVHNYSLTERVAIRAELQTPEDTAVIIQVSRMEEWKGHLLHLEALKLLRDLPGWACWMVGGAQRPSEASYMGELRQTAAQQGIAERIHFLGQRVDVPRLLAAADIHCQPNTGPEPFGITFIEALYAQLPVVTTALGGACEIVDATCGALVRPHDATALAAALRLLLTDPARRAALGAGGPARARQLCDPAKQTRRLAELLARAVTQEAFV